MKKNKYTLFILLALILALPAGYRAEKKKSLEKPQDNRIRLVNLPDEHKVDIFIDNKYDLRYTHVSQFKYSGTSCGDSKVCP